MKKSNTKICISVMNEEDCYDDECCSGLEFGTPFILLKKDISAGHLKVITEEGIRTVEDRDYIELGPKMWTAIGRCIKRAEMQKGIDEQLKRVDSKKSIASFASAIGMKKELIKV